MPRVRRRLNYSTRLSGPLATGPKRFLLAPMASIGSIESDIIKARIMLAQLVSSLLSEQNGDGGWGAVAGKQSNTEATAFAVLALQSVAADASRIAKAKGWLINRQNGDGSWSLSDSAKGPSWVTALAIIALSGSAEESARVIKAGNWVLEQEGGKPGLLAQLILFVTRQKRAVRLNQDLIGWPWTTGNFSWVEPTSYFMIALKRLKPQLPT